MKHPLPCIRTSETSIHPLWMAQAVHPEKGASRQKSAELGMTDDYNDHDHRPVTMITTIDNSHEDKDDDEQDDSTGHPFHRHLGTQNPERAPSFHMVAEPSRFCGPSMTRSKSDDIDPSSPASSSLASQMTTSQLHLQQLDPHELPDGFWTSPSSSSGGGPPEASDEQLDRLYRLPPTTSSSTS